MDWEEAVDPGFLCLSLCFDEINAPPLPRNGRKPTSTACSPNNPPTYRRSRYFWSGDDDNDGRIRQQASILISGASEANGVGGICLGVFLVALFLIWTWLARENVLL